MIDFDLLLILKACHGVLKKTFRLFKDILYSILKIVINSQPNFL